MNNAEEDHSIVLDEAQLAKFTGSDRILIYNMVNQIEHLTEIITLRARDGRTVNSERIRRKAIRWALEKIGVSLPPNPPVPISGRSSGTRPVSRPTNGAGGQEE